MLPSVRVSWNNESRLQVYFFGCIKQNMIIIDIAALLKVTHCRYCDGGELFHYIIERKHLNEVEGAKIMKQLFSALKYLHSHNISHR
jgi:hypothetical protein